MKTPIQATPGRPAPYGAAVTKQGTNFAIFSRHATQVWLLLFDNTRDDAPSQRFALDPVANKSGDIWHIHLSGVGHGDLYLYQIDGPFEPEKGHRFNKHKPLLDPYAKAVTGDFEWEFGHTLGYDPHSPDQDLSFSTHTDFANTPKCIVYGDDGFDWQGTRPLNRPVNETIIYETHVRSLTSHPNAGVARPGTYAGVIEKIPYFKELGVTAIELLPVHHFNEWEFDRVNPLTGERLRNYWGYNTLCFFAPCTHYSHLPTGRGQQVVAFKEMVRALHQAGLEVILDVVFNHTSENNHMGPTMCFKGIDNRIYYLLEENPRYYKNISGVGNVLACNHPIVQDFIIDSLRYWVQEMHVDGFRFDLATILSRDRWGEISGDPPLTVRIAEDPLLRTAKMIAEPWDIGGYQVGHFPGGRWAEWNDKYRDEVRHYWRGDGSINALATRLAGSADLYGKFGRSPTDSINFVAAHDGFTLNDLVSYSEKHNEANGENNQDGHNHNVSANYGVEGPTTNTAIRTLRNRQVKNFWATLLLSQGTPMINGGDEFRRTQGGNNNAYCHHNEISWYDWTYLKKHADVFRFARHVIALRKKHPVLRRTHFFSGMNFDGDQFEDVRWYDPDGNDATWNPEAKRLMCLLNGSKEETGAETDDVSVLAMFNADVIPHPFIIPSRDNLGRWRIIIDTALPSPYDISEEDKAVMLQLLTTTYRVEARSVVVMFAPRRPSGPHRFMLRRPG